MGFIKKFFSGIKENFFIIFYAFSDKRTPFYIKIFIIFTFIYLLSPIDIIPETFFPFGLFDDAAIVPAFFYFIYNNIPADLAADFREKARRTNQKVNTGITALLFAFFAAVILFLILLYLLYKLIF